MKLIDLYQLVVKKGIAKDPRPKAEIKDELKKAGLEFRKAKGADKKTFDRERLSNPYADTRILYGDISRDIRTIMVGIDMEGPELLAADRLNEKGANIDLVMAHHPEGPAWARFYDVMKLQIAILKRLGLAKEVAEGLLKDRMQEVERAVAPANHTRSVDIARLIDMPYMCVHTPADNHVTYYLQKVFDKKKPRDLGQVLKILKNIPEYADGLKKNAGPRILIGDPKKKAGKIFVDMTGGTEGPRKVFSR
ncbi:MAG: NGG1p interacting factor NIF3, partial [Candidatus Omnitrophica bacterium]|nr:NGG1p interacting factor NIF3 [Candidatus Omnitrophota bacterium]